MDSLSERRLQDLQMADLGTARREYISTVDKPNKFRNVRLEEIEAARISNRQGSDAQRMAERNKEKLTAWANVYQEIGDTGDLEDLNSLMDGQSHRAQLSAIIREYGGQSYVNSTLADDNFLRTTGRHPERDSRHGGRGGGIIGSRGRNAFLQHSPGRTSGQGGIAKLGHHLPQKPSGRNRPLDPAVDPDREYLLKSKSKGGKQQAQRHQPKPPSIKARRPVMPDQNYENLLADPQGFLAAARLRRENSTNSAGHRSASVADSDSLGQESAYSKSKTESNNKRTTAEVSEEVSKVTLTVQGSVDENNSTLANLLMPAATTGIQVMEPHGVSASVQSEVKRRSVKPYVEEHHSRRDSQTTQTETKTQNPLKGFTSNLPQPAFISPKAPPFRQAVSKATPEQPCGDLLLDFSSTPSFPAETSKASTFSSQQSNAHVPTSPAVDDLMDINFQQSSEEPTIATKAHSPQLLPPATISPAVTMAPTQTTNTSAAGINEAAIAEYLKEISMLNDLMANSPLAGPLGDMIKQRKQELEAKIFSALRTQTISRPSESVAQATAEEETQNDLNIGSGSRPAMHPQGVSTTQPEPDKQKYAETTQPTGTTRSPPKVASPLQKAVTAAPFVPSSSAWDYRSPRKASSSSESESPERSKGGVNDTKTHIIGDHLLPGRHGRNDSTSAARSVHMHDRPSISESSINFPSSQYNQPAQPSRSQAAASVLSGMKPPAFEGFSISSTTSRTSTLDREQSHIKAENMPFPGYQETARNRQGPSGDSDTMSIKPVNKTTTVVPSFPISAATQQYAINFSATVPQGQINASADNIPTSAAPRQYAGKVSESASKSRGHTIRTAPYIPISATANQYAVNANPSERTSLEADKSPNIPLSATTLQYAVNAPKSAFKKPLYPETVTPPSASRQHSEESVHTPITLSSPALSQHSTFKEHNDSRKVSGLYASKYADPYEPFR